MKPHLCLYNTDLPVEWTLKWVQWLLLTCCKWSLAYDTMRYFLPSEFFTLAAPIKMLLPSHNVLKCAVFYCPVGAEVLSGCLLSAWVCLWVSEYTERYEMEMPGRAQPPLLSLCSLQSVWAVIHRSARVIIVTVSQHELPHTHTVTHTHAELHSCTVLISILTVSYTDVDIDDISASLSR